VDGDPRERTVALVVVGLLAGALFTNVAQLPALETHESTAYRAFVRSDSSSMAAIGLASSPTVRAGRGVYLWLSELAPGAEVIVGADSQLDDWQLYGLARVDRIVETDIDLGHVLAGVDARPAAVVVDDEDGHYGPVPFTISLADEAAETVVVRVEGDHHDLIDVRLLPGAIQAELLR
jgi:hypothetical protein